jgi:hypothetical protein
MASSRLRILISLHPLWVEAVPKPPHRPGAQCLEFIGISSAGAGIPRYVESQDRHDV